MTKFVILTTCYNVHPYIKMNYYSNVFQSYKNFIAVYIDDKSKDGTQLWMQDQLLVADDRFHFIQNPNNGSQAKAYMYGMEYLEANDLISDEDVIVEVDGDDWLSSPFVLSYLNQIYDSYPVWMTYGQYQMWPSAAEGGHYYMTIDPNVDIKNEYRKNPFPYSHLKTYKYHLFKKIDRQDLIDPETGEYFAAAWDHALCLPMVEMAGMKHIYRCDDILYILNRAAENQNEGKTRTSIQKETEYRIRQGKVYDRL